MVLFLGAVGVVTTAAAFGLLVLPLLPRFEGVGSGAFEEQWRSVYRSLVAGVVASVFWGWQWLPMHGLWLMVAGSGAHPRRRRMEAVVPGFSEARGRSPGDVPQGEDLVVRGGEVHRLVKLQRDGASVDRGFVLRRLLPRRQSSVTDDGEFSVQASEDLVVICFLSGVLCAVVLGHLSLLVSSRWFLRECALYLALI